MNLRIVAFILLFASTVNAPVVAQRVRLTNAFPGLTFDRPVDLQHAGDGSGRLFVVEQPGVIRIFPNDSAATASAVFLDLRDRVLFVDGKEMGLLGLAFHPSYPDNGRFFVNYTAPDPRRTVIARFTVSATNPDSADPASGNVLLEIAQPYDNHNGGQLAFGPDGFLYIGMGDGGSGGDPGNVAQDRTSLLGSMLRIDIDSPSDPDGYDIPPDNPYVGNQSGFQEEIFAHGFRNPWRFSFDPVTGQLWCGDVGQSAREEIDLIEKGRNYGWRIMEGSICYSPSSGCDTAGLTLPVWDYDRSLGGSITGGMVYRGTRIPELIGSYVFGDFVSGFVAALTLDDQPVVTMLDTLSPFRLTSFGQDENNELFACLHDGTILRFDPDGVSAVASPGQVPRTVRLEPNYPNPFNPETTIRFQMAEDARVTLRIRDVLGRTVATLIDRHLPRGEHRADWRAGSSAGGTYVAELIMVDRSGLHRFSHKMMLLR